MGKRKKSCNNCKCFIVCAFQKQMHDLYNGNTSKSCFDLGASCFDLGARAELHRKAMESAGGECYYYVPE